LTKFYLARRLAALAHGLRATRRLTKFGSEKNAPIFSKTSFEKIRIFFGTSSSATVSGNF